MAVLLNNVSSDSSGIVKNTGGMKVCLIRGDNFGGGSVELSIAAPSDPSERFHILSGGIFISDDEVRVDFLPNGVTLKAELKGSTGASNVFVEVL